MNYFEVIQNVIYELEGLGCLTKDLKICFSPKVERKIIAFAAKSYLTSTMPQDFIRCFDVEVDSKYPFNHIMIFHKEMACYRPELCKIIEVMEWSVPVVETIENGVKATSTNRFI